MYNSLNANCCININVYIHSFVCYDNETDTSNLRGSKTLSSSLPGVYKGNIKSSRENFSSDSIRITLELSDQQQRECIKQPFQYATITYSQQVQVKEKNKKLIST